MKKIFLVLMSLIVVFHVRFALATDMENMECYQYAVQVCSNTPTGVLKTYNYTTTTELQIYFGCLLQGQTVPWNLGFCRFPFSDIGGPPEQPSDPKECAATRSGSIVQMDNQVLGEQVPIVGTDFDMYYFSNRVIGKKSDYQVTYSVTGNVPMDNTDYALLITVLNETFSYTYNNLPNRKHLFEWNGLINGVETIGSVPIKGASIAVGATRPVPADYLGFIGNYRAKAVGMGA